MLLGKSVLKRCSKFTEEHPCRSVISIEMALQRGCPEVFLGKGVLKMCSKFTGEHPCRSAISIKLLCDLNSPVNFAAYFQEISS